MEEYQDTQVTSAEQEGVVGSPTDGQGNQEQEGANEQRAAGAAAQEENGREDKRMAAARRSGSQEGYKRAQKEVDEQIAAFGRTDPRTGKAIRNMADLVSFFEGQEEAEVEAEAAQTKKSKEIVRREREAKRLGERELEKQRKEREDNQRKAEEREFFAKDYAEFVETHGKELFDKLAADPDFNDYAEGKIGKWPLEKIYNGYQKLTGKAEQRGTAKRTSKEDRSTGTGSAGGGDGLTAAQRAGLDEWNKRNPRMAMTAKEWLSR